MKLLFCAYREWAIDVYRAIAPMQLAALHSITLVTSPEQLLEQVKLRDWDVICVIGWSWLVPADIVNNYIVIGMHPSDLPDYAGGSPIQNQILDGVVETKATLFRLNEKFDEGMIIDKERISLGGHLSDVFESIGQASVRMIAKFMNEFPNNKYLPQEGTGKKVRRLKPEHSRMSNPTGLTCKQMWDQIRCREDPYPNVYFEDETGKLIIKYVEFVPKT